MNEFDNYIFRFTPKTFAECVRVNKQIAKDPRLADDIAGIDDGYNSGRLFFGLNDKDFCRLFLPSSYLPEKRTSKGVASRIIRLVKKHHPDLLIK